MNIRTNVFIWIFFATILPLTALALGATYYSEIVFERDVTESLRNRLNQLSVEIQQQHHVDEQFVLGLARSPAVLEIVPVLQQRRRGTAHREINIRRARINRFFEGFQTILTGYFAIRILDYQGNALIKVTNERRSPAIYEGIEGIPLVEPELNSPRFMRLLKRLPKEQVSALDLSLYRKNPTASGIPKLDYIVPLYEGKRLVGALTVTMLGGEVDKILEHTPRPYQGSLFVVELNSEDETRNGLILYDERTDLRLAQERDRTAKLSDLYDPALLALFDEGTDGEFQPNTTGTSIFYTAFLPFSGHFLSWGIGLELDRQQIVEPFKRIRTVIWALAGIALLITLGLANIGVRNIARPIRQLAIKLKGFADGDRTLRAKESAVLDEIGTLGHAFNYMADTIEKVENERDRAQGMMLQSAKLASLGEMAAGIGHELNNPLNNILSYAKLLQREIAAENAAALGDLKALREETLRASEIVKGVLNFARQMSPQFGELDIADWLQATVALVSQAAKNKDVSVRILNKCTEGQTLEGDRGQLQQALINLLINAIHASDKGGQLVVSARMENEWCHIAVRDEGPGIDNDAIDRIFDPFFSTRSEGNGTGLGLSISLGIVEHHGGRLEIRNNPDQGVTATMILPLQQPPPSVSNSPD